MRRIWMSVAILVGYFAAPAHAGVLNCNNCDSVQMAQAAGDVMLYNGNAQPHYVVDFADGEVRKYVYMNNLTEDFNWEYDLYEEWVSELPVESVVAEQVAGLYSVVGALAYDVPGSAWEIIGSSTDTEALANYLHAEKQPWQHLAAIYGSIVNPIPFPD